MIFRSLVCSLVLASLTSCQPAVPGEKPLEKPLNEQALSAAWSTFKAGRFEETLKHADLLIQEFRGAATRRQKEIGQAPIPNGVVTAEQKAAIFRNGVLNDVAVAYYLKGRASDKLGRREEAVKALVAATQFPAARAWDSRGWFFAPASASERYLATPDLADAAPHEICLADAWSAYNRGDYKSACASADRVIIEFEVAALNLERDLARRNVRVPSGVVDAATKARIFANGLLNDVGTACYVKGRSAEALGDKRTALDAYRAAVRYSQARCWDPAGWFWVPSETSADRLEAIR